MTKRKNKPGGGRPHGTVYPGRVMIRCPEDLLVQIQELADELTAMGPGKVTPSDLFRRGAERLVRLGAEKALKEFRK